MKDKNYESLRRKMRALIADQNNTITNIGRVGVNKVATKYGYHNFENIVNTKIMERFLGEDKYCVARELYQEKALYDGYSEKFKKENHLVDPKSPIDYLDLRTMFHFYNFRKLVIKLSKEKTEDGEIVYTDLDKLLKQAEKQFYSKSDETNMFLKRSDINFERNPIRSYRSISSIDKKAAEGKNAVEKSELTPTSLKFKKEVLDYLLLDTVTKKELSEQQFSDMKNYFYKGFVSIIKGRNYTKPVEQEKLDEIVGKFSGDLNFRTLYNQKKSGKTNLEIQEISENNEDESIQRVIFTKDEYTLFERDGKYFYCNSPEQEYTDIVYGESGEIIDDNSETELIDGE